MVNTVLSVGLITTRDRQSGCELYLP